MWKNLIFSHSFYAFIVLFQDIILACKVLLFTDTNNIAVVIYMQVIKETEEFEKSLKEMEYLQGDSTDLLKYARDVNCHFASKKCKDVIVAARKLMTSKMHNTVKVGFET